MTLTRSLDYYDEQILFKERSIYLMEQELKEAKDLLEVQSFQIKNEKGIRVAIAIQALWRGYMVRKYTLSREDQSESEEEEPQGDWCYGTQERLSKTYIMAGGGSHWWNYVVEFDVNTGEQKTVYIESRSGKKEQDGYLYVDEEGNRLMLEYEEPEPHRDDGWVLLESL